MSTTNDLVEETLSYLYAGTREVRLRLQGAHDDSQTTFTFVDEVSFPPGSVLSVGLEQLHVWEVGTTTAIVQRGWQGSTPAAYADRTPVTVNPKFPAFGVLRAINSELAALSSPANGLFQIKPVEFTFNPAVYGYNLAITDPDSIYEVRYDDTGPEKLWPEVSWKFIRNANTTDFPSGYALVIWGPRVPEPGRIIRVTYKAPYGSLLTLTDDVQVTTGLSTFADDIPPLGAAFRLVSVREAARSFFEHQSETRRATEVPSGSQLRGAAGFIQLRETRIREERARLARQYPHKRNN